ncbi:MAG TPA: hypothetical protein VFS58_15935 [Steroidobacteraceae bacterium]|nr:hypothetical protein [Steroidobacteraceae bacterium]
MRRSESILSLALLGTTAVSFWLWGEWRDERARNADLTARAASVPSPVAAREVPMSVPVPGAGSPVSASTTAEKRSTHLATSSSPSVEPDGREGAVASQRRMLQEPQYREAWRAQQRLLHVRRRENVIRLLGFTPDEADAIVEIGIDRHLSWIDRPMLKPMTQEFAQQQRALNEQDKREDEAKFRELLGEEKYARFQDYMESRSTRGYVDRMRPQFTGADTIRDDQLEPLIAALHVERNRLHQEQQEYRASTHSETGPIVEQYAERELALLQAANERMHAAAAPILSDAQLRRFDTLMKRELDRQELEARMMNSSPGADESNTD